MSDPFKQYTSINKGRGHALILIGSTRCELNSNPSAALYETDHAKSVYLSLEQAIELRDGLDQFIEDAQPHLYSTGKIEGDKLASSAAGARRCTTE